MRRRTFLGGLAAAMLAPRVARSATDRVLVVYLARGGWDVSYVFDPHFGDGVHNDPGSSIQTAGSLEWAGAPSRPTVSRFLQQHSSRAAIVNGLAVGSISHDMCTRLLFTARRTPDAAGLPTVVLSGPRFPGAFGGAQVALNPTLSAIGQEDLDPAVEGFLADEALKHGHVEAHTGLARLDTFIQNAGDLAVSQGASWESALDAGLKALAGGLSRCVVVEGTTPVLAQWDSHVDNAKNQDVCFEHGFSELETISRRLDDLGLRDRAVVLAVSEMGRTPRRNSVNGKDHWPYTSLLAWGSGVQAGMHGQTDASLVGQAIDGAALTPARLGAGVLEHFDVDPQPFYGDASPWRGLWS